MCRSPSKDTKPTARIHTVEEADREITADDGKADVVYFHTLQADMARREIDRNSEKQAFVTLTAKSEHGTSMVSSPGQNYHFDFTT